MNNITKTIIISTLMILTSFTLVYPKDINQQYIIIDFYPSDLNIAQIHSIPTNIEITNIEIIQHKHTISKDNKPQQIFYPISENPSNLTYSKLIYTTPYTYDILLKGTTKQIHFFVPTEYYPTNTEKITTSHLKVKINYKTLPTKQFTTTYEPLDDMPLGQNDMIIITDDTFKTILSNNYATWKITNDPKITTIGIYNLSYITNLSKCWVNGTYGDATNESNGNHWIPDDKEVKSNWELFNDTQAHIRNFLRYAYDLLQTRYVMLVGDKDIVPPRLATTYATGNGGFLFKNVSNHASDLYYSNLHFCMNNNTNSYWMENSCFGSNWDEVDWGYDILVGRVLVSTPTTLNLWINKTKAYVNGNSQGNYLQNHIVAAKDNSNQITDNTWLDNGGSFSASLKRQFSPITNITFLNNQNISQSQWSQMDDYVDGSIEGWSGFHMIFHSGHSSYTSGTLWDYYRPAYCSNSETPNFVYSEGCQAGGFQSSSTTTTEHWLSDDGCMYAGITNSAYGWFGASTYFVETMMEEMFNNTLGNNTLTFAKAHFISRERQGHTYADGVWNMIYKETNFFGDPALEYNWYDSPWTPATEGPEIISIDNQVNQSYIFTPTPTIKWTTTPNSSHYNLQIANDSSFSDIVSNITNINQYTYPSHYSSNETTISFILPNEHKLTIYKSYYIKVRGLTNER
jgi:hypothetical protein